MHINCCVLKTLTRLCILHAEYREHLDTEVTLPPTETALALHIFKNKYGED